MSIPPSLIPRLACTGSCSFFQNPTIAFAHLHSLAIDPGGFCDVLRPAIGVSDRVSLQSIPMLRLGWMTTSNLLFRGWFTRCAVTGSAPQPVAPVAVGEEEEQGQE